MKHHATYPVVGWGDDTNKRLLPSQDNMGRQTMVVGERKGATGQEMGESRVWK